MANEWIIFVDGLKGEAGMLATSKLVELIAVSKQDANDFVRRQAENLERYLNLLALGEMTNEVFLLNVMILRRLTRIEAMKLDAAGSASAERLVEGIQNLILGKLVRLIL